MNLKPEFSPLTKTTSIRDDFPHLLIIFFVTLIVYLWSAPRTVVLEDDGLFILAAYFNGIAHPPGYPLYTLFGHFMTKLPIDSVAFRVHMLSALFGSLGCAGLWWLVRGLVPGRIYAYTASLTFGFSQVYWSQAIIAEVYTLNVLLFLLLFILALRYSEQPDTGSARLVALMGFLYGLGLSNHWPLLVLSTPLLLAVMWPRWRCLIWQIPVGLPFLLLGLLPYAWMVLRSQMDPEISFYGTIESWTDFWFVVSREGYAELDTSPSAGWWDKWQFCGFVLRESVMQLGPVGTLFSAIGLIGQWWIWPRRIGVGLLLGYVCNTFLLIGLLGFDYELLHRNIFRVYPLIAYCVLSIWMGLGMYILTGWVIRHWGRHFRENVVKVGIGIVVVGMVLLLNVRTNYRAEDDWAEFYAKTILGSLASGASLFASSDSVVATVGYLNLIENFRPDVTLYQTHGLIFSNRLYRTDKNTEEERVKRIDEFINSNQRTIYYTKHFPHQYGNEMYGLYKRVSKKHLPGSLYFVANPDLMNNYQTMFAHGEPVDAWEKMTYRRFYRDYCQFIAGLSEFNRKPEKQRFFQKILGQHCRSYHGYLGLIKQMLSKDIINWKMLETYFENASEIRYQAITKEEDARLDNYRAHAFIRRNSYGEAVQSLKNSIQRWPHPDNTAYRLYEELGVKVNQLPATE